MLNLKEILATTDILVDAALAGSSADACGPEAELGLRSIEVVTLVDLIEAQFEIILGSDDIHPGNFATRRDIAALVFSRLQEGP